MGKLCDAIRKYLVEIDFRFQEDREGVFTFGISGKNGNFGVMARAKELTHQIVVYARLPMNVAEKRRLSMCEFITRANFGLVLGNFEMDVDDGELRYKNSVALEDVADIPGAVIRHLIGANIATFDRYLPGMCSLLYADTQPAVAIRQIEGDSDSPARAPVRATDEALLRAQVPEDSEKPPGDPLEETLRSKLKKARSAAAARRGSSTEVPVGGETS